MGHHRHGVLALGHGSLAYDLTGNDKVEAIFQNPLVGLLDHEYLTVQTWIQIGSIPMFRVEQYLFVLLNNIHNVQFHPQLLSHPQGIVTLGLGPILLAYGVGMPFHTESGKEINPFYMHSLFLNHFGRQERIQASGDKGYCLTLLSHELSSKYKQEWDYTASIHMNGIQNGGRSNPESPEDSLIIENGRLLVV